MALTSRIRGLVYWLLAESAFAAFCGTILPRRVPTAHGAFLTPVRCNPKLKAALFFGLYEYAERYLVNKYLPAGASCVELGSSIGVVSACILNRLSGDRSMVLVEALPENATLLQENLRKYHASRRMEFHNKAVSYSSKSVRFVPGPDHISGRAGQDSARDPSAIEVLSVTLEEIAPGNESYSLVMDIEGAEHELIQNSALARCCCLIVELHGDETLHRRFIELAQERGLRLAERKHSVYAFTKAA